MSQETGATTQYLEHGRKQINICNISDITAVENPLDRLSTLSGNYKKNRKVIIKTKEK